MRWRTRLPQASALEGDQVAIDRPEVIDANQWHRGMAHMYGLAYSCVCSCASVYQQQQPFVLKDLEHLQQLTLCQSKCQSRKSS